MHRLIPAFAVSLFLGAATHVAAQSRPPRFDAAFLITNIAQRELDTQDLGFGGRLGFRLTPWLGLEGEVNVFPADVPGDAPVSASRLEGLFGVTVGPRLDRIRVFAKARAGALRFGEAPAPVACIAIFPPPLACVLANGHTSAAIDVGGGVELVVRERARLRFDVSSLLVRYPAPSFDRKRDAHLESFWGSNLRVSASLGIGLGFGR